METTSPKFSLNQSDFINWLKNILLFFGPIVLMNIGSIQTYILSHFSINPDVLAIIISAIVKLLEYFLRSNTTKVVGPTN